MNFRTSGALVVLILAAWISCFGQRSGDNNDYQYALIEAVKQKNLGNLSEAVKLYELVIKEKEDCDAAYYEVGTIYLMTKQLEAARKNLEKAYSLDPDNQWYTLAYLNSLGELEDYDAVTRILKEKIKENPDEVEWEYQLATVYFTRGKAGKAIRILDNIEKERGFSEKITLLKASIYEGEEKYDLALEEIEKVMVLFPEAIQFRIVAAELCMKNGDEQSAAAYYNRILEVDSSNIYALTNLTDYYRKIDNYELSLKYLAMSFSSPQIDVERKMAIMSYYLSDQDIVNTYPEELDRLIQVFVNEHPDQYEGRLLMADFYIQIQEYDKAYGQLAYFLDHNLGTYPMYMQTILLANAASLNQELISISDIALKFYPDSADIRFFKGIGLYEEGRYKDLIANLDSTSFKNFSQEEYLSQARMLYAEAYYRMEEYPKSDSLFEVLISEEPDNYMILNNYSYYLAERGEKLDQAREWSRKATWNNPDNATFLDTYAWVLFKLELYAEAEKYILNALEKGGKNDPEVNEHAGDIQVALESYEIARSYYMKAIILGGEKERLEGKIETLEKQQNE
ncbi:MAG: tetratricopeptide repeat protein [Bacteroidota bacterium]